MEKYTILIVDDEPINIDVFVGIFSNEYEVKAAKSGKEALKILKQYHIDLVLLDIMMPQMDGYEVAVIMQNDLKLKTIPFIFLMPRSDPESIVKGFEYGAADYVLKPFIKNELIVRVKNHIERIVLKNNLLKKVEDETQKRILNEQLLIRHARIAEMSETIGNIAHQWRQPLNNLSINLQLISMFAKSQEYTEQQLDELMDKSKKLIQKMSMTIDQFKNFFRVDKMLQTFIIQEALNESLAIMQASFEKHKIALKLCVPKEGIEVTAVKSEIEQVVVSVVNNAVDALVLHAIQNPEIQISLIQDTDSITISISDNGGGIDKKIIDKVFDPYFSTKVQRNGTGIGLYTSKIILEHHKNGTISVRNEDKGACFIIKIKKQWLEPKR